MTSPITAEERAEALYRDWVKHPAKGSLAEEIKALLASAIREAEDAALERAGANFAVFRSVLVQESKGVRPEIVRGALAAVDGVATMISSLKSTKETGHE